jgi:two-component system cell cycle sensor histidine kinase/response regulator CckA
VLRLIRSNEVALVVDDEPLDVEFIRRSLNTAGFRVLDAGTYDSAVQVFEEHHEEIGLLLLDVSLPGKNGVDLAKALLRRKPALRLLFISGHVGSEVIRFYGMRTTDLLFLQKPFTSQTLLTRVREILESSEPLPWVIIDPGEERFKTAKGE